MSIEVQHIIGESDEVIALLRELPYIRETSPVHIWNDPPHDSPSCYWADWQKLAADGAEAVIAEESVSEIGENLRGMSEMWFVAVPDHVVVLTFGDSHNAYTFLVDTKFGVVHYRESKWIPINPREVIDSKMIYTPSQKGMIPMLQGIFRQHGWASVECGNYRKKECSEAVKAALEKHFPTFEQYD
ncbi:hypothetical protein IFR04_004718 [Cadophora malorum]|uniref:Uncharacterized protein n=1 Tax=Cadophora malorum TaxID=108018 RepID=A0A8H8BRI0_9HELO|nr:hypothetical protein IFR04_004718 [Cadophora malorum]